MAEGINSCVGGGVTGVSAGGTDVSGGGGALIGGSPVVGVEVGGGGDCVDVVALAGVKVRVDVLVVVREGGWVVSVTAGENVTAGVIVFDAVGKIVIVEVAEGEGSDNSEGCKVCESILRGWSVLAFKNKIKIAANKTFNNALSGPCFVLSSGSGSGLSSGGGSGF